MNNKAIIGISLLLVLFLSGCTADPTGKVIYLPVDANIASNDTNQVKVSSNDTTPNYLFSKLAQGTNVTLSILNPGGDETVEISASGSFTDLNKVGVSATDNSPDYLFSKLQAGSGISLVVQNPGANENVLITSTGGTDTNCAVKGSCQNIVYQDGNARLVNIDFNGTISGGDFNQSIRDHNDSFSCPVGQAIQTIGNTTACIAVGSGGSGTTYTSGTPGTIQVNNDNNTISQNFDGNFWRMFALGEPYIDGNALGVINSLDLNNSLNYAKKTDGNGSILGTTNQVSVTNGLSRLFGDQNVVLSLPQNIDSTATPTFSELTLTLGSGSCFNVNVGAQQRFDVDCSTNTTTSGTHLPNQPGISDIGNSSNRWDDFFITDVNATGTSDFKTLCIGGDCKTNWPVSVSSDTNCSTSGDCNSMYIQKNPLADQNINNQDLNIYNGQLVLHAGSNIASSNDNIFEIWNQNGTRTTRIDQNGNIALDGNITFIDANSFIGGTTAATGRRLFVNANEYTGNALSGRANLWISANTYAFGVTGTVTSGLYFDASAPRGFKYRIDGKDRFISGAGSTNTDGAVWQIIRNSNTIGMLDGTWSFRDIGQKDMNWQPYIRRNGIENHWNAQVYLGTPQDLIIDGNWIGDINAKGDYRIDGNMVVDHNIYGQLVMAGNLVGVSCNTTCGAIGYAGPWNCVEADNVTGAASTCSDITVAHNCLCRN